MVFASTAVGEGMDRASLALPGDQDQLIAAVAAANPRTVVVLNTGGPVLMPWLERVAGGARGVVPRPGVRQGPGRGAVRRRRPGRPAAGHLPGHDRPGPAHRPRALPGHRRRRPLRRGRPRRLPLVRRPRRGAAVLLRPRPLLRRVRATASPASGTTRRPAPSRSRSRSPTSAAAPGPRSSSSTSRPRPKPSEPPRQLKGFAKVQLAPGATEEVSLELDPDELAAFDEASGEWIVHPGRYEVLVGRSSRDIRGRAEVEVAASRGRPVVP